MMTKQEVLDIILASPAGKVTERGFRKHFPEHYALLSELVFPDGFKFSQKIFHYLRDDLTLDAGRCGSCGKRTSFLGIVRGYAPFCSIACAMSNEGTKAKYKATCQKRYGVDNAFQSNGLMEKAKQTNLERYGAENPAQSSEVRERMKQTCLERYGVEHPLQNADIMRKAEATMVERYGTSHYTNKEKAKRTWREKSKDEVDRIVDARRKNLLGKYGVESPLQLDEVKDKSKRTCLERYGVEHPLQSNEIRSGMEEHCLERYGVRNVFQSDDVKDKSKQTNFERYGAENPMGNADVKEKIRKTNLDRYGVEWACMRPEAKMGSNDSVPNRRFSAMLDEKGIAYEREFPLGNFSYDFRCGSALVEIDPTITHNTVYNPFGRDGLAPNYHLLKSKTATENGYRCIHIWDWDDTSKIISMLKPKQALYARKLTIRETSEAECNEFLNKYHLQNTCRGQSIRLGLYMNDILVELMTFGKPRYNRNYEYELLRLCSQSDYMVVGGAERLFKYFAEHYSPQSIISYCDASKFDGKVYASLGFALKNISEPTKHWYNPKSGQHITDNLLRQRGFDQLFSTNYGKGTSNEELMVKHNFLPVCDCGQYTFVMSLVIKNNL